LTYNVNPKFVIALACAILWAWETIRYYFPATLGKLLPLEFEHNSNYANI